MTTKTLLVDETLCGKFEAARAAYKAARKYEAYSIARNLPNAQRNVTIAQKRMDDAHAAMMQAFRN